MRYELISGDNHIDLTYCPPDLWSSQAPAKWKLLVPRVEELEDGLHWFVEGQDQGMWNGGGAEVPEVPERGVSPRRRDAGVRLRVGLPPGCTTEADHSRAPARGPGSR